ncbi:MAG: 50S ribosomal protein L29 [Gemmatimonadetes bacterium RIFCSPLOWO2_12_FULL_68_9]|uniref:Large ribosomal subunit protein uL29 n=2 Tax=environmental samples TaxID=142185 RepID=A0A0H4T5Z2_9BACT|nr:50S ribosomal protein L29, large subunit ribosomal protein L29 [uncultured Gemmatimonadetes bacterium Rifle_16ft_4_minimus_34782]AKQ04716.1 50S ribosomal protein L29, large subunit ribosomal protein L29 [uncultured Gemmatimonadetes bacterium Rifle_16ft_4_minimus_7]OGU12675.1 MAG: 50S ribosomal protein L29 [Gemmatimonadetes bacterium RIFCSPLOWO2_12_FULL_68_9]
MALKDVENKPLRPALVRELSVDELKQELAKLEEAQFRLRFRSATEAIENPMQFRMIRRNIARIKTMLKEKAAT